MEPLKLNSLGIGKLLINTNNYLLNPLKEYIINIEDEIEEQIKIKTAIERFGLSALNDYHSWLKSNNFNEDIPDPTNAYVAQYYGKKSLWQTEYSQGIVVKAKDSDDFFIIMECSGLNTGFKNTQIILTLGGCL